jgi:transposase
LVYVYATSMHHHMKRLLWIGHSRKKEAFEAFFNWFGEARSHRLAFIASDMWRAFVTVIAARASNAVHVLDRFHVAKLLGEAAFKVRREEAHALRKKEKPPALHKARWLFLRNKKSLKGEQRGRLRELVKTKLHAVRASILKEEFRHFWTYGTVRPGKRGALL